MTNSSLVSKFGAITLLTFIAGCSGNVEVDQANQQNESASSSQSSETPSESAETAGDTAENAVSSGASQANAPLIPESFPKDVYTAEAPTDAQFSEAGGKTTLTLLYAGRDKEDFFVKSFQAGMAEQAWTEVTSSKLPLGTITNFAKDGRKCTISIGQVPDQDLLRVAIMLSKK